MRPIKTGDRVVYTKLAVEYVTPTSDGWWRKNWHPIAGLGDEGKWVLVLDELEVLAGALDD